MVRGIFPPRAAKPSVLVSKCIDRVADLLAAHVEERRRAVHVLDQIASAERLMLEIWVMRLDDSSQEGAS